MPGAASERGPVLAIRRGRGGRDPVAGCCLPGEQRASCSPPHSPPSRGTQTQVGTQTVTIVWMVIVSLTAMAYLDNVYSVG